ncbi:MAG: hypothetical protein QJR08_02085 [Bacillota bacterium]|nr:hypothetical protein [Bacillota bacterium]
MSAGRRPRARSARGNGPGRERRQAGMRRLLLAVVLGIVVLGLIAYYALPFL